MRVIRGIIPVLGLAAAGLVGLIGTARAQVQNADVGINQSYTQTSDSTTVSDGGFFSARVFFTNTGDYTTGTLTLPSTATRTLADQGYTPDVEIGYEDTGSLSYLNSTYGAGNYNYSVSGGHSASGGIQHHLRWRCLSQRAVGDESLRAPGRGRS
jgi:hypothetical protein